MSHWDSLVVVVGDVVGGEAKKAHQQVIKTHWCMAVELHIYYFHSIVHLFT